jgi:DNA-binding transcriptional MerR regulator
MNAIPLHEAAAQAGVTLNTVALWIKRGQVDFTSDPAFVPRAQRRYVSPTTADSIRRIVQLMAMGFTVADAWACVDGADLMDVADLDDAVALFTRIRTNGARRRAVRIAAEEAKP